MPSMSVLYLYVLCLSRSLNACNEYRVTEPRLFKTLKYGPVFCSCSRSTTRSVQLQFYRVELNQNQNIIPTMTRIDFLWTRQSQIK